MANATTSIFLDTRREKNNGTYPVKLRVTFERKRQYYSTPHNLTEKTFKQVLYGERQSNKEKELKNRIQDYENKASLIIKNLPYFSWQEFEKKYLVNRAAKDTINIAFDEKIKILREAGQISTAVSYECEKKSLDKFKPDAKFIDITPKLLEEYEINMLNNGNSKTTISMYLRSLRSIFNAAISNEDILPALYPFRRNVYEKNKYEIPEGSNVKKALEMAEIKRIFEYKVEKESYKDMAKDFWIFIYLTNGLNVKDLCLIQYKNINGNTLNFIRAKTARQKKEKTIQAILQPEALSIIKKWGNKRKDENTYTFPVLEGTETPERERQLIQQLTHVINDNMKAIAVDLKINKPLTTYVARHSFATVLKRSGASNEVIGELLGHSSLKTTQSYLDSFENETLKKTTKALTAFKK